MNPILAGVDWPAVLARLEWRVGPEMTAAVARATGDDRHAAFAHLIGERAWDQSGLIRALIDATTTGERLDACRVAAWLPGAAATFLRLDEGVNGTEPPPSPRPPADTGEPLILAPEIAALELPLLDLAADIGRRHQWGRLAVVAGDAGKGFGGYYLHETGTVLLDLETLGDRLALEHAWAHELAHAVDPDLADRNIGRQEAFAERLAPLLLEHEPAAVPAALALVAPPSRPTRSPDDDLPAPGVATYLAFAALPLAPVTASATA